MAYTDKSAGKYMLTETTQKLLTFKSHDFFLVVAIIAPAKNYTLFINVYLPVSIAL